MTDAELIAWCKEQSHFWKFEKMFRAAPDLLAACKAYEKWEADLLNDDSAWRNGLPVFTQELYDKWIEIQSQRNAAINLAEPTC